MKTRMKNRMSTKNTSQKGSILILTLVVSIVIMVLGTNVVRIIVAQQNTFKQQATADTTLIAADAGVKAAIAQLNKNSNWTKFGSPTSLPQNFGDNSTYTVNVTAMSSDDFKQIESVGKTYRDAAKTVLVNTKTLKVVVTAKRQPVTESIVVGPGGLHLYPNSFIPDNDVNVRGPLTLDAGSRIGTNTAKKGVHVNLANTSCSIGSSPVTEWPVRCSTAPLTSSGGYIYGTVCANDQTDSTYIKNPDTLPAVTDGLDTSCEPTTDSAPRFDKKSFIENKITTPAPGDAPSSHQCSGSLSSSETLTAGTRINGSLVTSFHSSPPPTYPNPYVDTFGRSYSYPTDKLTGRKCTYTISGDVYIDGDLVIGSATRFRIDPNLELEDAPIIVVNGKVKIVSGDILPGQLAIRNDLGTPVYIISFDSLDQGCSRSNIEPNANVQRCITANPMGGSDGILTDQEAMDSAAIAPPSSAGLCVSACGPYDLSGIALYYYFADFDSINAAKNNNYQIYALGAQGLLVPDSTNFTTAAPNAPFANLLETVRWSPVDYRQIY